MNPNKPYQNICKIFSLGTLASFIFCLISFKAALVFYQHFSGGDFVNTQSECFCMLWALAFCLLFLFLNSNIFKSNVRDARGETTLPTYKYCIKATIHTGSLQILKWKCTGWQTQPIIRRVSLLYRINDKLCCYR